MMFVIDPDNAEASVDAEIIAYVRNNTVSANNHLIYSLQAAATDATAHMGAFAPVTWRTTNVVPRNRLHVLSVALTADGTMRFYIDQTLVATTTAPSSSFNLAYEVIGARYGSLPLQNWFKGTLYHLRFWSGAITEDVLMSNAGALMTTYGIVSSVWTPGAISNNTLLVDQAEKQGIGATTFDGTALAQWGNQAGSAELSQGTAGAYPIDPGIAARINGRAVVRFDGVDDFLAGRVISNYTSAVAYEYAMVGTIFAVSSTGTVPYLLQQLICDTSEFFWTGLRNNAGSYTLYVGHWDGTAKSIIIPITLGTPFHLHVWFDGTNIRAYYNGVLQTPVAAGPVTNIDSSMIVCKSGNLLVTRADIAEINMWNVALSAGNRTSSLEYMQNKYEVL